MKVRRRERQTEGGGSRAASFCGRLIQTAASPTGRFGFQLERFLKGLACLRFVAILFAQAHAEPQNRPLGFLESRLDGLLKIRESRFFAPPPNWDGT